MTEEEKWKQSTQDRMVERLRRARINMKVARAKVKAAQEWVDSWSRYINHLKREALAEGLDPTQEFTSYE